MNTFTSVANLCKEPEALELGGRECMKLRLADNTFGKKTVARYFDAIVSGPDTEVAKRLSVGDQIVVTGTLQLSEYTAKKGANKGKKQTSESMPFAKIIQVTKSESFFSGTEAEGDGVSDEGDQDPSQVDAGTETASDELPF